MLSHLRRKLAEARDRKRREFIRRERRAWKQRNQLWLQRANTTDARARRFIDTQILLEG